MAQNESPHQECTRLLIEMGVIKKPFELLEVEKNIFLLSFNDQREMATTFLRFQEYYESPQFQGHTFSKSSYKKWYRTVSDNGTFSYTQDWAGFNIPSSILEPFKKGRFKKLSQREKSLLEVFKNKKGDFYIIAAVHGKANDLAHEVSHGRFYLNAAYREDILEVLRRHDISEIEKALNGDGGYAKSVLKDEVHSYMLNDRPELVKYYNINVDKFSKLFEELKEVELKHYPLTRNN